VARSAFEFVEEAKATIESVTPDKLAAELASGDVVVVDVRDSQDREHNGYIPGSIHIQRVGLEFAADPTSPWSDARLHPGRRVVVHCALGGSWGEASRHEGGRPRIHGRGVSLTFTRLDRELVRLGERFLGDVVTPGEEAYEAARRADASAGAVPCHEKQTLYKRCAVFWRSKA
jgi:rhodanese-related sulfurtransferase